MIWFVCQSLWGCTLHRRNKGSPISLQFQVCFPSRSRERPGTSSSWALTCPCWWVNVKLASIYCSANSKLQSWLQIVVVFSASCLAGCPAAVFTDLTSLSCYRQALGVPQSGFCQDSSSGSLDSGQGCWFLVGFLIKSLLWCASEGDTEEAICRDWPVVRGSCLSWNMQSVPWEHKLFHIKS